MERLGQVDLARGAYEAYGAVTDHKNFQGNPMPAFDDLPEQIREAWIAASQFAFGRGRDMEASGE